MLSINIKPLDSSMLLAYSYMVIFVHAYYPGLEKVARVIAYILYTASAM